MIHHFNTTEALTLVFSVRDLESVQWQGDENMDKFLGGGQTLPRT